MEQVIRTSTNLYQTLDAKSVLGSRVLSANGIIVGRVTQVRYNPKKLSIEGVVCRRKLIKRMYIGADYFDSISDDAVILTIDPTNLLIKRKVRSHHGEYLGRIKEVHRKELTNQIEKIVVKSFWRGTFNVSASQVKSIGDSIILKESYHAPRKTLFKRRSE